MTDTTDTHPHPVHADTAPLMGRDVTGAAA